MPRALSRAAIQKAYEHRDRLSEAERYLTVAGVLQLRADAGSRDRSSRRTSPCSTISPITSRRSTTSLCSTGIGATTRKPRSWRSARSPCRAQPAYFTTTSPGARSNRGSSARRSRPRTWPRGTCRETQFPRFCARLTAVTRGQDDSAVVILDSLRQARSSNLDTQVEINWRLGLIATRRGQVTNGLRLSRRSNDAALQIGIANAALMSLLDEAEVSAWFRGDKPGAEHALEQALVAQPLDSLPPLDRPYERLVWLSSLAGRADRSKAMLAGFDKSRTEARTLEDNEARHRMMGHIAVAEKRYDDAVREYRASDVGWCAACALPSIARAYDLAGNADSAAAVFERYIQSPLSDDRMTLDALALAGAHKRLGELYEAKGERQKAASQYAKFIELWKNADPELQPHVREVKEKLARLQRTERQ